MMNANRIRRATLVAGLACVGVTAHVKAQWGQEGAAEPAPLEDELFAIPAPPAPEDVLMLKLRDGRIQWGAIGQHDTLGFAFQRLDNGGEVRVPWSLLDPRQSELLRTDYGYVEVEAEEIFVDAERLLLEGGGTVEGVIVSREGDSFLVKTDGNLQMVPKRRVRGIESGVRLPALDVYGREELYTQFSSEADEASATSQLDLARRCEGILDFTNAVKHYEAALALGLPDEGALPAQAGGVATDGAAATGADGLSFSVPKVEGMLASARVKADNQEQIEYLRDADRLRKRKRFDDALALLQAFPTKYAGSSLLDDARKQETKLLQDRDEAAKYLVRTRWKYHTRKLTREIARGDNFEAARSWATEEASQAIAGLVLADVQDRVTSAVSEEDVLRLWGERDRGRYESSTYGLGTWLLGEDRAAANGDNPAAAAESAVSAVDEQRKAIEDRIKRYLENQKVSRRNQASDDEEDLVQAFWEGWTVNGRSLWLMSYYLEEAGDFEIRPRASLKPCKTCGGMGALQLLVTGTVLSGETASVASCPVCRGVKVTRRIYFR
ncbi:MAG: hypothetical protein P8R46_12430 [Planctomycetota bacterium]|nr:hypothetical protein [Planctomycetota bacterium]